MQPASKRVTMRDHTAEANRFARRALISFIVVVLALVGLSFNLFHLQITNFQSFQTRSNENRIRLLPVAPPRGLIYDRNGVLLADNRPVFSLEVIPEQVDDLEWTVSQLQEILGITDDQVTRFDSRRKRQRRFKEVPLLSQMSEKQIALFSVDQHKFPGVSIEARPKRYYPFGDTLTHALGYVARINAREMEQLEKEEQAANYAATHDIGKQGIEKYYEEHLHGQVGYQKVEVNNRGRIIRQLDYQPPVAGENIWLSIDINLQLRAQQQLEGRRGAVVAIEPSSGEVLSLYSNPSYDPNLFVHGISSKNYSALLTDPNRPLINRATQGTYPPASTIKPHLAILGLVQRVISPATTISDPGFYQLPGSEHRFRDWRRWGHGKVNMELAIVESCDTYYYDLAYRTGIDQIHDKMTRFGFGDHTGLDIHEESPGIMPSRGWKRARYNQPWYPGDTINVGIGQGYWTATPMQLTMSTSVLANRGRVLVPHLLRMVENEQGEPVPEKPEERSPLPLIANNLWESVLEAMRKVNHDAKGTARNAFLGTSYVTAGKTGTAQVYTIGQEDEYDSDNVADHLRDNAMYVGFAPYDKPEIAVTVVLENAGGGGSIAAPIARRVMDAYLDPEAYEAWEAQELAEAAREAENNNNQERQQ